MAIRICLDAGHYGKYNRSPVVSTYYESDMTWKLHLKLKAELEKYEGVEVITTRPNQETDLGLVARGKKSEGCDLLLSLHSNAVDGKEWIDYPVVYFPISGACSDLANEIAEFIEATMGTTEDGRAISRKSTNGNYDYYSVIYGAVAVGTPALIIEHSFHTNTKSTKWLLDDNNLDKLAVGEAKLIAKYYNLTKKPETKTIYRVQTGAYSVKDYAIEFLAKVRKHFSDAYMVSANGMYKIQVGAFEVQDNAKRFLSTVKNAGFDAFITTEKGTPVPVVVNDEYTLEEFVRDVQEACGAGVDGIAGPETLNKTVTVSASVNYKHPVVIPIQKRLAELGYTEVGEADGWAGSSFKKAVIRYQTEHGCFADGEITAKQLTWKKLLGLA